MIDCPQHTELRRSDRHVSAEVISNSMNARLPSKNLGKNIKFTPRCRMAFSRMTDGTLFRVLAPVQA